MPCRNPCKCYIRLAFTYLFGPSSILWSELWPAPPFSPMRALEVQRSRAPSAIVCEAALSLVSTFHPWFIHSWWGTRCSHNVPLRSSFWWRCEHWVGMGWRVSTGYIIRMKRRWRVDDVAMKMFVFIVLLFVRAARERRPGILAHHHGSSGWGWPEYPGRRRRRQKTKRA